MKHYQVNEFINGTPNFPVDNKHDIVDKKVSLLYDFYILRKHKKTPDARESAVREWLSTYATESQMTRALHNILVGDCTLNNTLKKRGYIS